MQRLQKIIAQAGIASRRKAEQLIIEGRVTVNGKIAKIGENATEKDDIRVDGKPIKREKTTTIMLNKPKGYVTTVSEEHGMKTVMDLIKIPEKVYPAGRLDKNTEGLLIMTNDGKLANTLTHPRFETTKKYQATLNKEFKHQHTLNTIKIEGKQVNIHDTQVKGNQVILTIHEGRKHIVRKLFKHLGYIVEELKRIAIGNLTLGDLKKGEYRELTKEDLKKLSQYTKNRQKTI